MTDQRDGDQLDDVTPRPDDASTDDEPPDDEGGLFGADDADEETDDEPEGRGFLRRHKALTILCSLLLVILLALGGWAIYLNHLLGNVDRIDAFGSLDPDSRPDPAEGDALTILLGGADNGDAGGPSIKQLLEEGDWRPGSFRSDTIMVLHIPEDRDNAYVVSIPRDSYVRIYDETGEPVGKHKINYAFSVHGPSGYVSTIEHLTGLRMDHLAIIDWAGFKDVVDALGGVELYIPQTVHDSSQNFTYEQGWHEYDGELALKYVRSRYGLNEGDFDRSRRQQNFLRAMLDKMASTGTLTNQLKFASALDAVMSNLTVDEEWSRGDMRGLAWSMRGIRKDDVTFMSAPLRAQPFGTVEGEGSVVYLDRRELRELFEAMRDDDMQSYVDEHPELVLPGETKVD